MAIIEFIMGILWFVFGFVGAYITNAEVGIVIARFAFGLLSINTALFQFIVQKLDEINIKKGD